MPFLPPNQQRHSTEGILTVLHNPLNSTVLYNTFQYTRHPATVFFPVGDLDIRPISNTRAVDSEVNSISLLCFVMCSCDIQLVYAIADPLGPEALCSTLSVYLCVRARACSKGMHRLT